MTKVTSGDWRHQLYFVGHLAKGLVYTMVGGLALATVIGQARSPQGPQQIVTWLRDEPGGTVLLVILAAGLFAYCAWRWYKAVTDESNEGSDRHGVMHRGSFALSGALYGLLGVYSLTLAVGSSPEGDKQTLLVELMQQPYGIVGVALLAAAAGYAAWLQYRRARYATFMDELNTDAMQPAERRTYQWMGRLGYGARVVVYLILAFFLLRAVWAQDPGQYRGVGGVLQYISQGAGSAFLAVIALGLFCYGAFVLVKARYRELS